MNIKKKMKKQLLKMNNLKFIFSKVFKGYILKKFLKGSFFDLIEQREINVELTEDQLLQTAQDMLKPLYSL